MNKSITTCVMCGLKLPISRSKYCSDVCSTRYKYEKNKGKMNRNSYEAQKVRALSRKLELITLKGGKCEICGYKSNLSALEFHHLDPAQKEFRLDSRHIGNTKMETILLEIAKCQLLCANCHRDLHNPQTRDLL